MRYTLCHILVCQRFIAQVSLLFNKNGICWKVDGKILNRSSVYNANIAIVMAIFYGTFGGQNVKSNKYPHRINGEKWN